MWAESSSGCWSASFESDECEPVDEGQNNPSSSSDNN